MSGWARKDDGGRLAWPDGSRPPQRSQDVVPFAVLRIAGAAGEDGAVSGHDQRVDLLATLDHKRPLEAAHVRVDRDGAGEDVRVTDASCHAAIDEAPEGSPPGSEDGKFHDGCGQLVELAVVVEVGRLAPQAAQAAAQVAAVGELDVHARRAAASGHSYSVTQDEYTGFVSAFPFEETPDQENAIDSVISEGTRVTVLLPLDVSESA